MTSVNVALRRWLVLFPAFGIFSALLWRAEIELHGWAGLGWTNYFHWAEATGVLLFIGCVLAVATAYDPPPTRARLWVLGATLLAMASLAFWWTHAAIFFWYGLWWPTPEMALEAKKAVASLALTPVLVTIALRVASHIRPGWGITLAACVLYSSALPLACWAQDISPEEAIKRGLCIPLLFCALALPSLPPRNFRRAET